MGQLSEKDLRYFLKHHGDTQGAKVIREQLGEETPPVVKKKNVPRDKQPETIKATITVEKPKSLPATRNELKYLWLAAQVVFICLGLFTPLRFLIIVALLWCAWNGFRNNK